MQKKPKKKKSKKAKSGERETIGEVGGTSCSITDKNKAKTRSQSPKQFKSAEENPEPDGKSNKN